MTRLATALFLLMMIGCSPGNRDEAVEREEVPIGPGSDSTALLPPDTPVSRQPETTPDSPAARDTTR